MSTELIVAGEMGKGGSGPVESVDTLISRQTVKTLFVVGEGVISEIEEVYLDTVSIDRFDADLLTRTGTAGQEVIEGFTDTEAPLPGFVGKVIDKGDENIPNVDISPLVTTNITNFVVNKFYRITSLGNATSAQWMAVGAGTKYVPAAIGMVFKAKKAGVGVTGAGVEKVSFQQNTYETAIPYDANRARLTFTIPVMFHVDGDGNTGGSAVELDIYTRPNSTANWNLVANFTKKGKTTHGYTFDKEVTRPSNVNPNNRIPWEIKVLRVTDDSATNDSKTQNKVSWSAVTQIYDTTNTYRNSALAGITLRDASQFGNKVPEIMFKVKGKLVLIPSNYNAATRVYTGNWTSGSWYSVLGVLTKVYTNNPAWIIYDVLTDTRAGLGLAQADIDIYSIYLLGKYADELIPYTEGINNIQIPRYTLDYSFQTRQPVRDFLSQILSICNANLITNELGQVAIVFQYPGQVVRRNITNANVVDGIFTYQSSNIEQRTTLVNVTYNNGKNFGRTDTATVFEQDLIDRYGLQPIDVVLPGCYYEAQAIRKARWTLYSNCHFTNFVTFNVFLDGLNYKIGDLVRVYDNYNQNTQQAGTIVSYSNASGTTTVIFDRTLTLNNGSYTFYCYDTSGTEVTKTISVAGSIATATTVAIPAGTTNHPDYDYQGYVTKYGIPATGVHLTDEFKLPSHITFSTNSIYSSTNFLGGTWTGSGTTWHFYPSIYNLTQYNAAEYIDYFTHVEYIGTYLHLNGQTYQGTVALNGTPSATTVYIAKQFPGAIDQRTVNASTLDRITLNSVVTLNLGGIFILSGAAAGKVYRITNITKSEESQYAVTGLEFNDSIFDYIDSGIDITPLTGDFVDVDQFYTTDVESISWSDSSATNGSYSNSTLHISWIWDSAKTQKYRANFKLNYYGPSANTVMVDQITTDNYDIPNPVPGRYIVTLWAINPFTGISSKPKIQVVDFKIDSTVVSTLQAPINVRITGTTAVSPQPASLSFTTPDLNISFDYNPDNQAVDDALGDYLLEVWEIAINPNTQAVTYTTLKNSYPIAAEAGSLIVDPTSPDTSFTPLNGSFQFSLSENLHTFGGSPSRTLGIKIYSRDLFGHISANPATVVFSNPVPVKITTTDYSVVSGVSSVFVNIKASTEVDVKGYLVWRSTSPLFIKNSSTLVYDGPNNYVTLPVPTATKYWYSVAAYDNFSKTEYSPSDEQDSTPASADATTWTKTGLQFTVDSVVANKLNWTAGTVIRNGSNTYTITAGTTTWTSGFVYVYFNPAVSLTALQVTTTLLIAVGVGCYPIATYTGGSASNIKGGDGNAFISGSQIIAGTVGASEIKAGSIVASLLDTTNAVITGTAQITDGIITNAKIGNSIMSLDYNPTTYKGWIIDKAGNINTYGSLGLYDTNGNVVFAGGNFNWNNAKGTGVPQVGATRNVFTGPWLTNTTYVIGDIVTDGLGYGWSCVTAHTSSASVKTPVYPITSNSYWAIYTVKGDSASSTTIVSIYRRVAGTNPSLPLPSGTVTYNFSSGTLTGLDNGWSKDVPAGVDPLYISAATAVGTGSATIGGWATPVLFVSNGIDGTPGTNTATVTLYQTTATSSPPTRPLIPLTYKFSDATIAETLPNNWQRSLPTTGAYRWITTATALGTTATDTILASEWAPVSLLAQDGVNGLRTAIMEMYQWATSAPTTFPSGVSTFTWANGQFTTPPTPNNWYTTPQTPVKGQTLYVARTIYTDSGTSENSLISWAATTATPRSIAGIDGTPGTRTAYLEVYKWSAVAPTSFPQGTSTYTWLNGTFTDANVNTNGWLLVPGASVQGQTLWGISQAYSDTGTSSTSSVTWSSISPYALGYAGIDGTAGKTAANFGIDNAAAIFNKNASNVIAPSAGITLTTSYQNITGTLSYQWQKNGANLAGATSSSYTVPTSDYSSVTSNTYKVTITGTINGVATSLSDTITIPMLVDGGSGPVVLLSNENITFGAPNVLYSGIDFSNGTCDITAYIGSTQLTYAASGANTFSLTYTSTYASVGAGSNPVSQILRIPAPTAMSAESAAVTITVTVRDNAGNALPLIVKTLRYNLSRAGAVGMSYWLSNTDYLKRSTSLVYSPSAITLNGYSAAGSGTPAAYACRFKIYEDGSASAIYTSSVDEATKTYTPSTTSVTYIKVEMYLSGGTTTLVDYSVIPVVQDGSQALTLVEPNSAVLLSSDSAGNVSSYAGSGTTIKVFEGSTPLLFTTGVVTKGYFGVSASVTSGSIAIGGLSGAYTSTCTVANHSNLSTDSANITYTINVVKADGSAVTLTDIQTLTKSKAGVKGDLAQLVIVNGEQAFKFAADSTTPVNTSITLSAALSGGLTTYSWEYWYANIAWLPLPAPNTGSTYSLTYNNSAFGTSNSLRVRCLSGTAYDEITIVKLYDGAKGKNAITGYLTNESAALPADSSGTVSTYAGASGSFKVFDGTTDVTNSSTFTIATATVGGVTITLNSPSGTYSASGTMNVDAASFTLSAAYNGVTINKVLSLTRVKAGVTTTTTNTIVADTVTITGGQAFNYAAGNTTTPTGTGIITLTASLTGTLTTYSWEYWTGSVWASLGVYSSTYFLVYNNNTAFVGDTARIRCLSGTKYDEMTIVKLYSGSNGKDAVVGYLTNETATFPADSTGVISDYTVAAGQFKVFSGTLDITSGYSTTYSVTTATVGGLTLSINSSGAYSVAVSTQSTVNTTNSFTFEVKAITSSTYGSVTVVKSIKYAKSKTGTPGIGTNGADAVIGQLSSDSVMLSCNSAGNPVGTSPYATVTMTVNKGGVDDSANWTYSASLSNLTSSSLTTSRTQNITAFGGGTTNQTGYIDFTASRTGYASIVKRCVFAKSIPGIAGAGTSYTGASDPTTSNPAAAINGDSYFQTTTQLMWVKVNGTWQKVVPQITSGNATQFIATAAIGQAQIGSAAIGTAQIIDANISTLKIEGNAVTVPLSNNVVGPTTNNTSYSGTTFSPAMCSLTFTNPSITEPIKILVSFGFSYFFRGALTAGGSFKGCLMNGTTTVYSASWGGSMFISTGLMSIAEGAGSSSVILTVAAGASITLNVKHQKTGASLFTYSNAFISIVGCRR